MKIFRVLTLAILILTSLVTLQVKASAQPVAASFYNMPVAEVAAVTREPVTYTIKKGDSLSSIAVHYKLTWQSLYCDNKAKIGSNPDVISPGERLSIPSRDMTCDIVLPAVEKTSSVKSNPVTEVAASYASQEPAGTLQQYGLALLNGNSQQYDCLNAVINIESGWNVYATNPSSGAYGIPQALPGSKMSAAGADWATNGYTQLRWMVDDYITSVYGTPCNALAHEEDDGYY